MVSPNGKLLDRLVGELLAHVALADDRESFSTTSLPSAGVGILYRPGAMLRLWERDASHVSGEIQHGRLDAAGDGIVPIDDDAPAAFEIALENEQLVVSWLRSGGGHTEGPLPDLAADLLAILRRGEAPRAKE